MNRTLLISLLLFAVVMTVTSQYYPYYPYNRYWYGNRYGYGYGYPYYPYRRNPITGALTGALVGGALGALSG
ncbi:hypothetical protein Y032_0026g1363 [Ancylostoma ceylanicum]|uniref:Glycine zipper 2TM domain-containing protein n=1 Tax=Ancylostoma ceylanicum TaxID=53326 RepID=A0A016UUX6_9BILA|nr:hypothetical protein Y032_0026g1363 [Ancylostoma ceylanicum]